MPGAAAHSPGGSPYGKVKRGPRKTETKQSGAAEQIACQQKVRDISQWPFLPDRANVTKKGRAPDSGHGCHRCAVGQAGWPAVEGVGPPAWLAGAVGATCQAVMDFLVRPAGSLRTVREHAFLWGPQPISEIRCALWFVT